MIRLDLRHELFVATIQRYMEIAPNPGHDVEIDIRILLNGANVTVIISDWKEQSFKKNISEHRLENNLFSHLIF